MEKLIKKLKSHDPFEIAENKNIILNIEPLGNIFGYYNTVNRIQFIHINEELDERMRHFTCAHELGHALLHRTANTPKLSAITIVSELKIEKEANEFATKLLIDGSHDFYDFNSKFEILDYYGIPHEMERFI